VRTATFVTAPFLRLAQAQADARGRRDLTLVVVTHPVGAVPAAVLSQRVAEGVAWLRERGL
jgi:hypothetical protein